MTKLIGLSINSKEKRKSIDSEGIQMRKTIDTMKLLWVDRRLQLENAQLSQDVTVEKESWTYVRIRLSEMVSPMTLRYYIIIIIEHHKKI